jgi:hypothetical protein
MNSHPENRFVAHFDMLGMTTLTMRNPDLAWKKLCDLGTARQERLSLGIQRLESGEIISNRANSFTFSDTMVAFSTSDTTNDAMAIFLLTTEFFVRSLYYGLPLRGAITHGRFAVDHALGLFSGPALVKAYELGESGQWLGVSLDEQAADAILRLPCGKSVRGRGSIVPWDVPCKGGASQRRMAVNWPETHRRNYLGPVPLTVGAFYQDCGFAELFGPFDSLEPSAKDKYENTVAFFNAHFED